MGALFARTVVFNVCKDDWEKLPEKENSREKTTNTPELSKWGAKERASAEHKRRKERESHDGGAPLTFYRFIKQHNFLIMLLIFHSCS